LAHLAATLTPLPYAIDTASFRNASFRIVLSLEITSAFTKQRPIRLPLPLQSWYWKSSGTDYFTNPSATDDTIWTDRLIAFCADVVQFRFGSDITSSRSSTRGAGVAQWKELKQFELLWEKHKPFTYGAIQHKEPNQSSGEVFPQLWCLSSMHVAGMQYLELARILLAAYDPSVPRLDSAAVPALKKIGEEIRTVVFRQCRIVMNTKTDSRPWYMLAGPSQYVVSILRIGMSKSRCCCFWRSWRETMRGPQARVSMS
jgi:hypothetical protein